MNQELEQYLKFFIEYRQRDWLEWLATAEFAVNNKVHLATKVSVKIIESGLCFFLFSFSFLFYF